MYYNAPPSAFQHTSRSQDLSRASLAVMDASSSPNSSPQAPQSSSYTEIADDEDDDDLPPIPDDWAAPIATLNPLPSQPPFLPTSGAQPCLPACVPATASTSHLQSAPCSRENTYDYKWLTDIFANQRYDVRWNFNSCPEREADIRRRRDVALALMATRALHFEEFSLEIIDEGLPAAFHCGGPLYDYEIETMDEIEPIDEAEAERQWYLEELQPADEEREDDEENACYYPSDMSDKTSSYEDSLLTPTDESPMQDQDAPFSAESLKDELKQAIKALDREMQSAHVQAHVQAPQTTSPRQSTGPTTHRHHSGEGYGAKALLAATLSQRSGLAPHFHHDHPSAQLTPLSRIESLAMSILTWPATLLTYAVSSLVHSI